jgi:hypothetical protein
MDPVVLMVKRSVLLRTGHASSHVFSFVVLERKSIDVNPGYRFMKSAGAGSGFADQSDSARAA